MKFRWVPNSFGRSGIVATAESADSQPLFPELWLDYNIENFNQDRFAVACALTFGHHAGQRIAFGAAVSQGVAKSVESILPGPAVSVDPVVYEERAAAIGDTVLVLGKEESNRVLPNDLGHQRQIDLQILPSDQYSGGLLKMDRLSVSGNAWLHSPATNGGLTAWYPYLASAVLLSADLSASAIRIDAPELSDRGLGERLQAVLGTVGLNLLF